MIYRRDRKYIRNRKANTDKNPKKNIKEFLTFMITIIVPIVFAISCLRKYATLNFYGISQDLFYVNMNESIPYIIKHLFLSIFIFAFPYLNYRYPAKGFGNKLGLVFAILITMVISNIYIKTYNEFHKSIFPVICLLGSIIIYNLRPITNNFFSGKPLETLKKKVIGFLRILFSVCLLVFSSFLPLCWLTDLVADTTGLSVSQKQDYQVLENNKVVVTTYKYSFIVLKYETINGTTYIFKNDYELISPPDIKLKAVKFDKVKPR